MITRIFAIGATLCLFCTSASALTDQECRAKYKTAMEAHAKGGVGAGMSWDAYQVRVCGISPTAAAPKAAK